MIRLLFKNSKSPCKYCKISPLTNEKKSRLQEYPVLTPRGLNNYYNNELFDRPTRSATLSINRWFCPYQACARFALECQRIQQRHQRLSEWRIICETAKNFKSVLLALPRPDLWPLFPYRSSCLKKKKRKSW